jgi:hypothetical protein
MSKPTIRSLESLQVQPEELMVSFEVVSLFTKVPIADSLVLLCNHFEEDVLALFKHVLTSTYFCSDGQFYEQTDGVAMGSPLTPVIANFFMEDFEKKATEQAAHKSVCWFRHVDDTFVIWPHGQENLAEFLNHLNGLHNKIQFTMEKEAGHLPILDTGIYRKTDGSLGHKVYPNPTHTNLYLHQNSHHHPTNKQSVLASLINRAKALCDQEKKKKKLQFLSTVFKDNRYSPQQIRRVVEQATPTTKTNNKPTSTAYIPYT